jgi:hypothetical protein
MKLSNLTADELRHIVLYKTTVEAGERAKVLDELLRRKANPRELEVGDLVAPLRGKLANLRSGIYTYTAAVVVSVKPFVLCSSDGDMLWHKTVKPDDFEILGKALLADFQRARTRFRFEEIEQ